MKRILALVICMMAVCGYVRAQDKGTIAVRGSAEQRYTPDTAVVSITLREYGQGRDRVNMNMLETQLYKAVTAAGVPAAALRRTGGAGNRYYRDNTKDTLYKMQQGYQLKVLAGTDLNGIIAAVDPRGVVHADIESFTYSGMNKLRVQAMQAAMDDARAKAQVMAARLGQTLGGVKSIKDNEGGMDRTLREAVPASARMDYVTARKTVNLKFAEQTVSANAYVEFYLK